MIEFGLELKSFMACSSTIFSILPHSSIRKGEKILFVFSRSPQLFVFHFVLFLSKNAFFFLDLVGVSTCLQQGLTKRKVKG